MKSNPNPWPMLIIDSFGFYFFGLLGIVLLISALSHGRIDQIFYAAACSTLAVGFFLDRRKIQKRSGL